MTCIWCSANLAANSLVIMPIAAFGIYAAICILMNYALAMTMLPAVLIWRDERRAVWKSATEIDLGRIVGLPWTRVEETSST